MAQFKVVQRVHENEYQVQFDMGSNGASWVPASDVFDSQYDAHQEMHRLNEQYDRWQTDWLPA